MRTKKILMMVVSCFILFSCKKEKENENTPACGISMDGLAGAYKITKIQYKAPDSDDILDFMKFSEECEKDDIITLNKNGTYHYEDGGVVCDPTETDDGIWLVKDKTIVSDGRISGTVLSYDCKTLVYYMDEVLIDGDRLTFTAERQ